jgi:hypothetical protein
MSSNFEFLQAPKQKPDDPLTFLVFSAFGVSEGTLTSIDWLAERGLKWKWSEWIAMHHEVTLPDANTAMLFKLAFC